MRIELNGHSHEVPPGESLPNLIASLGLPRQGALVEHNGRALLRSEWPETRLAEGDQVEILRVVAGG